MDGSLTFKPKGAAFTIGMSLYVFTMLIPLTLAFILVGHINIAPSLKKSLPLIVGSQSLMAFPAIACLLAELKIVNTEVGRLAVATTMFYDLLAMSTCAIGFSFLGAHKEGTSMALGAVGSTLGLALGIIFVIRPLMMRFVLSYKLTTTTSSPSSSNSVNDLQLSCVFVLLFISVLASEVVGQHYFLGPMLMGLALPDSSPLGGDIVCKLDTFVSGMLYPTFLTISGLKTDISTIRLQETGLIVVIVVAGFMAKFAAIMIPAKYGDVPTQDAFVLSLVLNARGINELLVYNLILEGQV